MPNRYMRNSCYEDRSVVMERSPRMKPVAILVSGKQMAFIGSWIGDGAKHRRMRANQKR